jgi:hypothetical protein
MKTELTEEQIEELFAFCKKHYVRYYDVQLELVDHLANAIEEKMNTNKNISFEKALHEVYKGFGVMGFSKILSAKEKEAGKRTAKIKRKIFWSYFTPPKLALTACVFFSLFVLRNFLNEDNLLYLIGVLLFLLVALELVIFFKTATLYKKSTKPLMLFQTYHQNIFTILLLQVFAQYRLWEKYIFSTVYYAIFSVAFTCCFIGILSYKNYCLHIYDLATTQYPQAFAEK